jgi:hypothetical protein
MAPLSSAAPRDPRAAGPTLTVAPERKRAAPAGVTLSEDGSFCGYASLFDRVDLGKDVVARGAFARSLARSGTGGIKLLYQHDPLQPIGIWRDIREDARGLFVVGQLLSDVERAREVLALIRAGAVDGLSIGFKTVRACADAARGVRHVLEVDLWEISIVTFPMLPDARIESVKSSASDAADTIRAATTRLRRAQTAAASGACARGLSL